MLAALLNAILPTKMSRKPGELSQDHSFKGSRVGSFRLGSGMLLWGRLGCWVGAFKSLILASKVFAAKTKVGSQPEEARRLQSYRRIDGHALRLFESK